MLIQNYSGDDFDLYGQGANRVPRAPGPWRAPVATDRIDATVRIPGSKSLTNRELVLAAIANEPTVLRGALLARDTQLMMSALRKLGVDIQESSERDETVLTITPPQEFTGAVDIDCGLAGTVMRFVPPLAALALGPVTFDGDAGARKRPMSGTLDALQQLGVKVRDEAHGHLPFAIFGTGRIPGGEITIDASASSQFVSGLLLSAPRFEHGLTLRHVGDGVPSLPHIEMTLASLRARGVNAHALDNDSWRVEPGEVRGGDIVIEPDLSNAAPFLSAAVVCGGTVRIPNWPEHTTQVGDHLRELLVPFGARFSRENSALVCTVERGVRDGGSYPAQHLDLGHAGELAPNIAALLALGSHPSTITGIGHLRGHETDRIHALVTELTRVGVGARELTDGLEITPAARSGALWQCYADHRMATSGAIVGLVTDGVTLDDVECTSKTLPDFVSMWERMLGVQHTEPQEEKPTGNSLGFFDFPLPATPASEAESR